jgi:hypothetical protein
MERKEHVTILMFGSLYSFRQERGLSPTLELPLPPEGKRALDGGPDSLCAQEHPRTAQRSAGFPHPRKRRGSAKGRSGMTPTAAKSAPRTWK